MAEVRVKLREEVAQYVTARVEQENLDQSEVVADLLQRGFEQKWKSLQQFLNK